MSFSRIISFFLTLVCLFSLLATSVFSATSPPSVSAECAVLIDADTGNIIYEKNADKKRSMASTTKIMTAIVALENYQKSNEVSISSEAVGVEGSSIYLREGEVLTMEQLLYALLLESANDAAVAIAVATAGSVSDFASIMNEKANELGLKSTSFQNPHGLDNENHYTTAYELALIAKYALDIKCFREIVSTYKKTIPMSDGGARVLINHNKMLRLYDGAIGVKTGFTKKSGRCLVSAAERDGLTLIAVTLNAPNDWNDHTEMLDYGFSKYKRVILEKKEGYAVNIPVIGGRDSTLLAVNENELSVTLPTDSGEPTLYKEYPKFLYAPIKEGDIIGRIYYKIGNEIIAESSLKAAYGIEMQAYKKSIWQKISDFFYNLFN